MVWWASAHAEDSMFRSRMAAVTHTELTNMISQRYRQYNISTYIKLQNSDANMQLQQTLPELKQTPNHYNHQSFDINSTDGVSWNPLPSNTYFIFNIHADSNADADLPRQLHVTKQELILLTNNQDEQLSSPNWSFNLPITAGYSTSSASFSTVAVAVFIVYHFMLFCRPGTQNNLLFLNAQPNSMKNCRCTSDRFRCGKICQISTTFKFKFQLCHTPNVNVKCKYQFI